LNGSVPEWSLFSNLDGSDTLAGLSTAGRLPGGDPPLARSKTIFSDQGRSEVLNENAVVDK
jgi:hypothetical protein